MKLRFSNNHVFIIVHDNFQINMDVIHEFLKEEIEEELKTDIDTQFLPTISRSEEDQLARSD